MRVLLGSMELRDAEKPDSVQHGGGQILAVNQFPGGNVSIQNFGPTYDDIEWEGWFEGPDAMDRMYRIGNMRQKGEPIVFVTEKYSSRVVIEEFQARHKTNFFIPFSIRLKRIIQLTKEQPREAVDKAAEEIAGREEKAEKQAGNGNGTTGKYIVKSGDTLAKIAKQSYGDANAWEKIYQANKDILTKGPHLIYSGQELTIP